MNLLRGGGGATYQRRHIDAHRQHTLLKHLCGAAAAVAATANATAATTTAATTTVNTLGRAAGTATSRHLKVAQPSVNLEHTCMDACR